MKLTPVLTLLAVATLAAAQQAEPRQGAAAGEGEFTPVQEEAPAPALRPGGEVSPAALVASDWLQGSAPTSWEKDKVYVLDCWASWCGPCISAIPHLNDLHKKFENKGLRVCGMNVWEEGRDTIAGFVERQGDRMSYPVAYTGPNSAFEKDWLKAGSVRGIPQSFVVKNGRLLFSSTPSQLDEQVVTALLEGGDAEAAVIAKIRQQTDTKKKSSTLLSGFREAMRAGDQEAMGAAVAELETLDPEATFLPQMRLDLAIAGGDWESTGTMIDELAKGTRATQVLGSLAFRCDREPDQFPREMRSRIAGHFATAVADDNANPTLLVILSRLQWSIDDKDGALATAKTAAANPGDMPAAPFERYVKSVEDGKPGTATEVFGWLRQAMISR